MATATGRRETRRTATRARLLQAARELIGEGGFDAVTIADVTERAEVGFGTFYGYFETKDAIVRAVIVDAIEHLAEANDALTADLDDPAEVMAVAVRHSLGIVHRDPVLAGFIVQVVLSADDDLWNALRQRMVRDVKRGVQAGRFSADRVAVVGHMIGGSVFAVLRAKLRGELGRTADAQTAASVLVLLGLPEDEAVEIANRRLP
jgi:AcrR family transcriptional regulator